ncbi:odorant receptor 2a-like [Teleopsis dalmanni]|uniref:odorant receptor 2a-like n=1 Tax=Teleopsis dalmanni TaxID=139649 RepID=UPI0018CD71B7|nr:odorant receptor 2a-like [Teleopsis dalmanni]
MKLLEVTDNGQKLDSGLAFHYWWLNLRILGMHPTKNYRFLYYLYAVIMNVTCTLLLPVTLWLNLLYIDNFEALLSNLSMSVTITTVACKQMTVLYFRNLLLKVNTFLEQLDKHASLNQEDRHEILKAVRICHLFHGFYVVFFFLGSTGLCVIGFTLHQLVFNGWFPRVVDDAEVNYYLAFAYQSFAQYFLTVINACTDMYPQSYMVLLIGHVRTLNARIERIGKNKNTHEEDNLKELVQCVKDHKLILEYFDCINPVISTSMCVQFLITALVLCSSTIYLISYSRSIAELIVFPAHLFALLIEIFPCCWYMDELQKETSNLTTAVYSCKWYEQNQKFKRAIIVFMQNTQKPKVIMAGGLAPVTLQSFVAIIKFAFSLYTLLSNLNTSK